MGYTGKKVRYHTTLKDIAVSVLVLISCAILCLYGMARLGMANPSQYIADRLMQNLNSGGPVSFKAESMDRMFLKNLIINKPSLSLTQNTSASASEIEIQGGLPLLLSSYMFGSKQVNVNVRDPELVINESLQNLSLESSSSNSHLQTWLESNTFSIETQNLRASMDAPELALELEMSSLDLLFDNNKPFPTIRGSAPILTFDTGTLQATLLDSEIGLNEEGSALIEISKVSLLQQGLEVSFAQLVALGTLESLAFANSDITIDFSLADLKAERERLTLAVPILTSTIQLKHGAFDQATLSYDQLSLSIEGIQVHSPTATVTGRKEGEKFLFGLATKQGDLFKVTYAQTLSLDLHTLQANAQYEANTASIQLSLGQIQYSLNDLEADLSSLYLQANTQLEGMNLIEAELNLQADAQASFKHSDINFSSPLVSELSYRASDAAMSSSAYLTNLASSFTTVPLSARMSFQSNRQGSQLQAELDYQDMLFIRSVYDMPTTAEGTFFFTSRLNDFPLSILSPTFEAFAPFIKPYYQDATNLIGNISFQSSRGGGSILPFDGKAAIELALLSAKVGKVELDAGFTFLADIKGDSVFVNAMTLASSGYRLVFSGSTELNYWLPRGELDLYRIDDGQRLLSVNFFDQPPSAYRFNVTTPFEKSLLVDGTIRREGSEFIVGSADFSIFKTTFPFTFRLDTSTLQFLLSQQEHLSLSANLAPPITGRLVANDLRLPDAGFFALAAISGDLEAEFFSLRDWQLASKEFRIEGVQFKNRSYDLLTSLTAKENQVLLSNMQLKEGGHIFPSRFSYTGTDFVSLVQASFLAPFEATFSLDADEERKISISLLGYEDRINGALQISSLPLDRFFHQLQGTVLDFSALGYSDFKETASVDGFVELTKGNAKFTSKLAFDQDSLTLYDSAVQMPDFTYIGQALSITDQLARSTGKFEHIRHLTYKDQVSQLTYDLAIDLGQFKTIFDLPKALKPIFEGSLIAELSLSDILLYGEGGINDGTYLINLSDGLFTIGGDHLDLSYQSASKHLQATMNTSFGIGFAVEGSLASSDFGLSIDSIYLPLPLLNRTFLKPIFSFLDGVAQGELYLAKTADGLRPYGQLWVDSARMQLFWLPQDIITMKNISASSDGSRAITPRIPFFSTNTVTGKTIEGYGWLGASFDGLRFENYEIHAESGDQMVFIWLPMQGFDADIKTYAGGTFNLFGVGFETWLDGKVMIQDSTMTLGIKDLPSWYIANNLTTTEFEVVTGKNVSFSYPNTQNPFIKATITENQNISFLYDHITDEFIADGTLSFRSGEIYYFQKNFFITEGSLALHTDALTGKNQIQPTINLRAKMTDFDAQGERIDIFLVLRDSGLSNLNPQFESIPAKDINEILEILGQSILPTGAYGEVNLYSVVSLAAAATDVAERLGYIDASQTTALTESIRISLGLDMFSIRSNILQNILFDALPGSNIGGVLTPLARYLNNTSIFMGKYVGRQFFLQALVHLSAMESSRVKRSFISPDLSLDLELSLDWVNPLGTFSFFTQPNELSFTNILDTIGFSVTKRIVLR
ncbi:hypothetical protein SpiBuddy_1401 [Sphaerochaeta globosa str. Buddy]|uniref:Uncharacterized protein n=1 Tax=Sphaerochaeta globosa (strain ATCC BAA-1886 / DSM 22777 / Buddy) TaxID=158189 RepID=F0RZ19_SPHGB|nr:hypothetical protein SpiBuddy_1401 [Sphaerochaeta globosa str. Buddy]